MCRPSSRSDRTEQKISLSVLLRFSFRVAERWFFLLWSRLRRWASNQSRKKCWINRRGSHFIACLRVPSARGQVWRDLRNPGLHSSATPVLAGQIQTTGNLIQFYEKSQELASL